MYTDIMTVEIKVTGAIEVQYNLTRFPTEPELERLRFFRRYRSLTAFTQEIRRVQYAANGYKQEGLIRLVALLRREGFEISKEKPV